MIGPRASLVPGESSITRPHCPVMWSSDFHITFSSREAGSRLSLLSVFCLHTLWFGDATACEGLSNLEHSFQRRMQHALRTWTRCLSSHNVSTSDGFFNVKQVTRPPCYFSVMQHNEILLVFHRVILVRTKGLFCPCSISATWHFCGGWGEGSGGRDNVRARCPLIGR